MESSSMVHLRFQLAKQLDLIAQFTRGMQNLKSRPEFSRRSVISLDRELGDFAQSNCGKKQENKPRAATDVSGGATPKQPSDACNRQDDERRATPAMVSRAGAPCPGQHQQRGNHCEEKKNMVQVHLSILI